MLKNNLADSNKQISKITYIGIAANIFLCVIKVSFGFFASSLSLVADGIHSLSDMITDIIVLVGIRLGSKEPDEAHPYGHGKIETFSTLTVGLVLLAAGAFMIYNASMSIINLQLCLQSQTAIGDVVVWIALVSVILKEILYWKTQKVAIQVASPVLYANAWHHRSDAISSVMVIIGFIVYKLGYLYADQIAAIAVAILIMVVAAKIIHNCFDEFFEHAADPAIVEQIENIIRSEQQIRNWHKLRTRNIGRQIFIDVHILVDPDLSITEAHKISELLEQAIHDSIHRPVNIIVHVEPHLPHLDI